MEKYKLFDAEYKFVSIIWDNEPINSTELVKLCADKLGWKKSTTYTVLKKLCERGILQNRDATVTSLVKREDVTSAEYRFEIAEAGYILRPRGCFLHVAVYRKHLKLLVPSDALNMLLAQSFNVSVSRPRLIIFELLSIMENRKIIA